MCDDCNSSTSPVPVVNCNPIPQTSCDGCVELQDASCVGYMTGTPDGFSQLTYLNLPGGVTLQQFMEAVDIALRNLHNRLKVIE